MRREKVLTLLSGFLLSFLLSFSGVLCVVTGFSLSSQGLADLRVLALATLLLLFVSLAQERGVQVREKVCALWLPLRWLVLLGGIMVVLLCGVWGSGFNEAAFIYYQF